MIRLTVSPEQRARWAAPILEVPDALGARGVKEGMTWEEAARALGYKGPPIDVSWVVAIHAAVCRAEFEEDQKRRA